jgi:hypothetical protein
MGIDISGYGGTRDESIEKAERAIYRPIQKRRIKKDLGKNHRDDY